MVKRQIIPQIGQEFLLCKFLLNQHLYSSVLKKMAAKNPRRVEKPLIAPPLLNASGIIVWAIMVSMAPAAIPPISAKRKSGTPTKKQASHDTA